MRRWYVPVLLAGIVFAISPAFAIDIKVPTKTSLKASVVTNDAGTPLFDSTPGKGTTFTFTVPAASEVRA
jgi:hypothetical protein